MKKIIYIILFIAIVFIGAMIRPKESIAEHNVVCADFTAIKDYARCRVTEEWGKEEWQAFYTIIEKESNWDYKAANPTSSARGLPQALTKLHDLPEDYLTNPHSQIEWAIQYISDRYGTASVALKFHIANNHY